MVFKRFWKAFIFLFLISFLIINWNDISWIFNYRVVSGLIEDYSEQRSAGVETKEEEEIDLTLSNGKDSNQEKSDFYEKENVLEIFEIGISVPLIFIETADQKDIVEALDLGAVHFFDSVLPGEAGETIVLGHSAPAGWPRIKHDWIFTRINELENGNEITIYFNNKKFNYSVTNKFFLERGEEIPEYSTDSENVLMLISCWPPGKDVRRIAVEAKLNY